MQLITINEASTLAQKSIQTIRRMIKKRHIEVKKQKTPQGFNYLIIKQSLIDFLGQSPEIVDGEKIERSHRNIYPEQSSSPNTIDFTSLRSQLEQFGGTIQKLIEQNQKDKDNFFQLIKTFQDRNSILENRVHQLEAPKSSWWKLWRN